MNESRKLRGLFQFEPQRLSALQVGVIFDCVDDEGSAYTVEHRITLPHPNDLRGDNRTFRRDISHGTSLCFEVTTKPLSFGESQMLLVVSCEGCAERLRIAEEVSDIPPAFQAAARADWTSSPPRSSLNRWLWPDEGTVAGTTAP